MAIPSTGFSTFGFHTRYTMPGEYYDEEYSGAGTVNVLNMLGYMPVLGLIPCVCRLILPLCDETSSMHNEPTEVKIANYIRGFFEGLGLGALYLIPDLIATIYRFAPCTYSGRDPENPDSRNDQCIFID